MNFQNTNLISKKSKNSEKNTIAIYLTSANSTMGLCVLVGGGGSECCNTFVPWKREKREYAGRGGRKRKGEGEG